MPSLIDALVVELKLDASQYDAAQRKALGAFQKTGEESTKAGKTIEESSNKAADSIKRIAEAALGLFAVFVGARGLKDFAVDLTSSNSALGRFAANLGVAPQTLGAWGMAISRVGGDAAQAEASIGGLASRLFAMKVMGEALPLPYFRVLAEGGLGMRELDQAQNAFDKAMVFAKALQNIAATQGRPAAYQYGKLINLDEGSINLILAQGPNLAAHLRSLQGIAANPADVAASQALLASWVELSQQATDLGRKILTELTPALQAALGAVQRWLTAHPEIKGEIVANVTSLLDAMKGFANWVAGGGGRQILDWLSTFANSIANVAQNLKDIAGLFPDWRKLGTLPERTPAEDAELKWRLGIGPQPVPAAPLSYLDRLKARWRGPAAEEPASAPGWFGRQWQGLKGSLGYSPAEVPHTVQGPAPTLTAERLAMFASIFAGAEAGARISAPIRVQTGIVPAGIGARYGSGLTASQVSTIANYHNTNTSAESHVHNMTVNSAAADAAGIAADLAAAMRAASFAVQANGGPQ